MPLAGGAGAGSSQAMASAADALPSWVPEESEPAIAVDGGSSSFDMEVAVDPAAADGIVQAPAPSPDPQVVDEIFAEVEDNDEDAVVDEELLAALV